MDVDADDHGEKGVMYSGVDAHIMKMVIIEYPVIYPFTGSTVLINLFVFLCAARDRWIKPDVPFRFGVNAPAVSGGRAFLPAWAGIHFAAGKGAAPFTGMFLPAVSPVDHAGSCHAQGSAVCVNGNGVRDGIRPSPVGVEVNKRADPPFPTEAVSGIVVMGGVQTEIPDRDIGIDRPEFTEGDNVADAVVTSGIQKTDVGGAGQCQCLDRGNRAYKGCVRNKRLPCRCSSPSVHPYRRNDACRNSP